MKNTRAETKTILITGASSGIGQSTAIEFARHGYTLIITYKDNQRGIMDTQRVCRKAGALSVYVARLDVTSDTSIDNLYRFCHKHVGQVDILVNNAAVISWKTLEQQSDAEIDLQIKTNLVGLIKVTKKFLPIVSTAIVNVASKMGKFTRPDLPVYCATKFAVRGFTQALAQAHPELLVCSVNPDLTATPMTNYKGRAPSDVSRIIYEVVSEKNIPSGSDVDVWSADHHPVS